MRRDTEPEGPQRVQAPSLGVCRSAGMSPVMGLRQQSGRVPVQEGAGERCEGKGWPQQGCELPGEEPVHEMLNISPEKTSKVGENKLS